MSDAFTDAYHASRNRPGITRHVYGNGTYLLSRTDGWGGYTGGAAMCPDGKVRTLKRLAAHADTYFSVPAAVSVWVPQRDGAYTPDGWVDGAPAHNTTVTGFITMRSEDGRGYDTESGGPVMVYFMPYTYRKNHALVGDAKRKRIEGLVSAHMDSKGSERSAL